MIHGHIMPLTTRYLALLGEVPISPLLREILRRLIDTFADDMADVDTSNRMQIYESRNQLYLAALAQPVACFDCIRKVLSEWLRQHQAGTATISRALQLLQLDAELCPRVGAESQLEVDFDFDVAAVYSRLNAMELPAEPCFEPGHYRVSIRQPGGVGEILFDADGGSWLRGEMEAVTTPAVNLAVMA
jgi:hypothetical protein